MLSQRQTTGVNNFDKTSVGGTKSIARISDGDGLTPQSYSVNGIGIKAVLVDKSD